MQSCSHLDRALLGRQPAENQVGSAPHICMEAAAHTDVSPQGVPAMTQGPSEICKIVESQNL